MGCHTWPDTHEYTVCPACGESTDRFSNMAPLDPSEASSLRKLYAFEAFYEKWDAERDPDRLKP